MKQFSKNIWHAGKINPITKGPYSIRTSTLSTGIEIGYLLTRGYNPVFIINRSQYQYDRKRKGVVLTEVLHKYTNKGDRDKIINGARKFCRYYEREVLGVRH